MYDTLYAKKFDNGAIYIGITNNFNRRMHQHEYQAYVNNSQLLVHKAMRKHNHTTERWSYGIQDRELILELEIQTIQQLKSNGIKVYNMTDGGEGTLGSYWTNDMKLNMSKLKKGTYPSEDTKKKMSISRKKRVGNLAPSFGKHHSKKTKALMSKQRKGINNPMYGKTGVLSSKHKPKVYYATKSSRRYLFKEVCKNNNWNINNFEEIYSNETENDGHKKYYYTEKIKGV